MEERINYDAQVKSQIDDFWKIKHLQSFTHEDIELMHDAYELAYEAHKPQTRKGGGPYITHPISVARIVAEQFQLGVNPIIAAFLHDVVEDTSYTIEDIQERFGDDVAFLVGTVTKEKKKQYEMSKQLDNYKQMLDSIHYDIRALLIKLADRLHNMRTLSSMRPDKQMKIAGETDYFYAPLANRLGLYEAKTELENLSMQYRCQMEYADLKEDIEQYKLSNGARLQKWCEEIKQHLLKYGIEAEVYVKYCSVYTLWKKMQTSGSDFKHINHKYAIQIVFPDVELEKEKYSCLKIYSALTDQFKEMPGSLRNYLDTPKENGYQAFHIKILSPEGAWQKIHISSQRMARNSKLGCVSELTTGVNDWISKFKYVLRDMSFHDKDGGFMEGVVSNFYYDDILVFTPKGNGVVLPKGATAIDYAYEIHNEKADNAQYARINGVIMSMKTVLQRGDCVEIGFNELCLPKGEWLECVKTYKAKSFIVNSLRKQSQDAPDSDNFDRCPYCSPIPGEEVVGFKIDEKRVSIHKRNCPEAVKLASQQGDNITAVEFKESYRLYGVSINIKAIDRYHLLSDLVNVVTEDLHLSIDNLTTVTVDEIVDCTINFRIHSVQELNSVIAHIKRIENVDEVKRVKQVS